MNNNQKTITLFAIIAYLLVAVSFFVSVQIFLIALIGLLLFTIILAKNEEDNKAIIPVTGALFLYFVVAVLETVFEIIDIIVNKIISWVASDIESLSGNYDNVMSSTIFSEICDIIIFFVALGVVALCVLSVIALLTGKDFSKTIVGKVVAPVLSDKKQIVICPNCGKKIKGEFCANCGTKKEEQ